MSTSAVMNWVGVERTGSLPARLSVFFGQPSRLDSTIADCPVAAPAMKPVPRPVSQVLNLSCPNRPGIVAAISMYLFESGWHILEAQQHEDAQSGRLFMRLVFDAACSAPSCVADGFKTMSKRFGMTWTVRNQSERPRVLLLASKFDHCLADLIYRWRIGELAMDVVGVVSNYPRETYAHVDLSGLPFHYLPVTRETKSEQERALRSMIRNTGADLVVLARYMQVLSPELAAELSGCCINIHHSFLPSFKGAKPYHQAHERGVKLIGATAHYVTSDLDEGPIIEQDVERVSHRDMPDDLIRKGRDIERRVLARAVRCHLEGKVMLSGNKAIVFAD
jgi:formyltetrahydrofolate deformylase